MSVSFKFSFALEIISSEIPSLFEVAKALLVPGIPISNLYVGISFLISNSTQAFSKPSVTIAKF